jgi:hypothetical protein
MSRSSSTGWVEWRRIGQCYKARRAGEQKRWLCLEQLEHRQLLTGSLDGPTVVAVRREGVHAQPTVVVLQFSQPLDPGPAQNPSNYLVMNFKSRPIGIGSAVYAPATQSVTLFPRQRINLHRSAQLLVHGTFPSGLTSTAGLFLDGANTGHPGSDFSTLLTRKNLAGPA